MSDELSAPNQTIELTLTINGQYEPQMLERDFSPDDAYGPVRTVIIERDMASSVRNYNITDASAKVVGQFVAGGERE